MLHALEYPFDLATILRKRKLIREQLMARPLEAAKVAILGGATSAELKQQLELFLLAAGIEPSFYESEYNRYYEDVMLDCAALAEFSPQFAVLYTSSRNITTWPALGDSAEQASELARREVARFEAMWDRLTSQYACLVIQASFDPPPQRASTHLEATAPGGRARYVARLNVALADAIAKRKGVMMLDAQQLSSSIGLDNWHSLEHWYSYKLPTSAAGTLATAHALSRMIAGARGKARKCLVLDLDDTLWGGVIGDDGVTGIKLGRESALGEAYLDFQAYCLELKARGVLLAVASKNELANAREGFTHPDSLLKYEDFSAFVANWEPKDQSLRAIAAQLNIGLDSLVFVDDNPAERALVRDQLPDVKVPEVGSNVVAFATIIERNLYFERPELSLEDLQRGNYYTENRLRDDAQAAFTSYDDYLASLQMKAEIGSFSDAYLDRVTQLTNKTNQFNLTTRRYTLPEITALAADPDCVTLYGRLADRFGDNGLVSVVVGQRRGDALHVDLWLMSCRVLKRNFEQAMLDQVVARAERLGVRRVVGYYVRTPKNDMVADHYGRLGFTLVERDASGNSSIWSLDLSGVYAPRNTVIKEIAVHG